MTDSADELSPADRAALAEGEREGGKPGRWKRMVLRTFLLIVIPLVALWVISSWYAQSGRYVTTDNAYIKTPVIAVSPSIDGRVVDVAVRENQTVKKGDLLFRLDPKPHQIQVRMTDSRLAAVRYDIETMRADYRQTLSEIAEAQINVDFFKRQFDRQKKLQRAGVTTSARVEQAEFDHNASRQRLAALRQKIRKVLAGLGGDPNQVIEAHPLHLQAQADHDAALLNLAFSEVRAADQGTVTRLRMESGEWVEEGKPVFGLIAGGEIWIEANLKETQLTHVRVGQQVTFEVDAYPGQELRAKIHSISPATGAEFAVLPPQNASGNWVKVVQRIPVRLEIEQDATTPPLRAGMTASISIDTERDRQLINLVDEAIAKIRKTAMGGK
jgi:membrane fusion protein (multidrug efflux system)